MGLERVALDLQIREELRQGLGFRASDFRELNRCNHPVPVSRSMDEDTIHGTGAQALVFETATVNHKHHL